METDRRKEKNTHDGHRERVKKKVAEHGLEVLAEHEVLELLLFYCIPRVDTNEIAHRLLDRFGSFAAVLNADLEELAEIKGMNENKAFFLKLIPQMARYYLRSNKMRQQSLDQGFDMAGYVRDLFIGEKNELLYLICLDSQNRIIQSSVISRGVVNELGVNPRQILQEVLRSNAVGVVLAHNHPGGNPEASPADIEMTLVVARMLSTISVRLEDHLIISGNRTISMKKGGYVKPTLSLREESVRFDDINGDWFV